jgi:hypothetical protein
MGIHSLPARHWGRLTLVGLLGLTLALATVSAGHASNRGAGHAVAAKKCKKKKKHSASSAKKKKKCKKVHRLPLPAPLTRATLTWGAGHEVDLHAFDASGNHAGWAQTGPSTFGVVNNIPNANHNGDIGPTGGTESFTDNIYVVGGPSNREFAYVACLYNFPDTNDYTATFTGVTKGGTTTTLTLQGTPTTGPFNGDDIYVMTAPGGPSVTDLQAAITCEGP